MKKMCSNCQERLATFKSKGKIKSDKEHDLCKQCWESLLESAQVKLKFSRKK